MKNAWAVLPSRISSFLVIMLTFVGVLGAGFRSAHAAIEARTFQTTIVRVSASGSMVIIDAPGVVAPPLGRVILLRQGTSPVMGMRVVKLYPGKTEFAAKKVRAYGSVQSLAMSESYESVEKLGDVVPQSLPALTAADRADLKEVETGLSSATDELGDPIAPPPPEGELDELGDPIAASNNGEPPPPPPPVLDTLGEDPGGPLKAPEPAENMASAPTPEGENEGDEIDHRLSDLEVRETQDYTPNYQWFTLGSGMFLGTDFETESATFFMGATARYQIDLGHRLLTESSSIQDALSLEGGFGYYTVQGYAEVDDEGLGVDEYRIIPLIGTLRYTLWLNDSFGVFAYAGLTKNFVTVVAPATNALDAEDALALLSASKTSFGAGMMFQVGPSWFARLDAGTDFLGAGVVLAF